MTKTVFQLLSEGKPFCCWCKHQRQVEPTKSGIRAVDIEENHFETCPYWKQLVLKKELQKHPNPELVYEALDCLSCMSLNDWKAIGNDLYGLGGQPVEVIKRVEALRASQFGRC